MGRGQTPVKPSGPPQMPQQQQPAQTQQLPSPQSAGSQQQPQLSPAMQVMVSMQAKQNRLAPVAKPQGLDPVELLNERENRLPYKYFVFCCVYN